MPWSVERANGRKEVQREDKICSGIKTYYTLPLMSCISGPLNANNAGSEVSCCVALGSPCTIIGCQ